MATDPAIRDHQTWLGYLQPEGLVVSPAALVDAQVAVNTNALPLQQRFLQFIEEIEYQDGEIIAIQDLGVFLREFLGWPEERLVGKGCAEPIPEQLKAPLREFGETLEPDLAFIDPRPADPARPWLLLLQDLPLGTDLDAPVESAEAGWAASPTRRFERLLGGGIRVPFGWGLDGLVFLMPQCPEGPEFLEAVEVRHVDGRRGVFEDLPPAFRDAEDPPLGGLEQHGFAQVGESPAHAAAQHGLAPAGEQLLALRLGYAELLRHCVDGIAERVVAPVARVGEHRQHECLIVWNGQRVPLLAFSGQNGSGACVSAAS